MGSGVGGGGQTRGGRKLREQDMAGEEVWHHVFRGEGGSPPSLRPSDRSISVRLGDLGFFRECFCLFLLSEVDGGGLPGQLPAVQGQQGGQRLLPEATHPHPLPQAGLQQGHGAEQVPPGHPHLPLCL